MALRVPTPTGSVTDLSALLEKSVTVDEVNDVFRRYAKGSMSQILKVSEVPGVFGPCGRQQLAIVNLPSTSVLDQNFVKVLA